MNTTAANIQPPQPAIDRDAIWKMVGYDPHEAQAEMHNVAARFKVPVCGRRFGKSTWAVREFWPYYFIPRSTHWIVGPTYELGEREFEVLYNDVMAIPAIARHPNTHISYSTTAGNMKIRFPWDAMVKVVSAEKPRSLLGKGLSTAIMSEAAEHDEMTWNRYVRPALSDKRGLAAFPTTPKGFNWLYHYWRRGKDPEQPSWASWHHPSWHNTHIFSGPDDEEFDEIKANTSEMLFRQEYGAEFVAYEGRVYDEFSETIHVRPLRELVEQGIGGWKNFWAIDFGYTNPFVCLDIMVDVVDNVYVWREYYERGKPTMLHADALRERTNPRGWHLSCIFADPSGAEQIDILQRKVGQVWARRVGWFQGVEAVKSLLRISQQTGKPRLYIDPSCVNLISELYMLHFIENKKPWQQNAKEQQHSVHDHACDALRYFAGEYFILGAGATLSSVYTREQNRAAATSDTFFQYDQGFTLDNREAIWPS